MVNWKSEDSLHRLIAAIIAASPSMKLDYNAIAVAFGEGATYDSIEGQCRKYRKMAAELKANAEKQGVPLARQPRTPRGPRNGITKLSATPSTGKGRKSVAKGLTTPTTYGSRKPTSEEQKDVVFIDDTDAEDNKTDIKVKLEDPGIIPSIEEPDSKLPVANGGGTLVGVVIPKKEAITIPDKGRASRPRKSAAVAQDSDVDEYMDLRETSPSLARGRSRTRRPYALAALRKNAEYDIDVTDEEVA